MSDWTDAAARIPAYRPKQAERRAPCQGGCVSGGDTRGWIGLVSQRNLLGLTVDEALESAWRMITDINPFPAVMGRVCPHPCETNCHRTTRDAPVAINALERFLGDWAIGRELALSVPEPEQREESVGVIGAGPSGLSFAYQMARRGYGVSVYEQREEAGGMLRFGIPDYRLPPGVLDAEIARISALGVDIQTSIEIGRDLTFDDLHSRHDFVYVGIGAQQGIPLRVLGADGPDVMPAIEYLRAANRGEPLARAARVLVIGGGNTAIDAARTARRTGAEVTIAYRRTRAEMPAIGSEIDEALAEGVHIEFLTAPVEILREGDQVTGVRLQRLRLGSPDADGRRRPEPIVGSQLVEHAGLVLTALSQQPDEGVLTALGIEGHSVHDMRVSDTLYIGGDATGPDVAGRAIAAGRRAAEAAHAALANEAAPITEAPAMIPAAEIELLSRDVTTRASGTTLDPDVALHDGHAETTRTITEDQFLAEVERCYSCGSCLGCAACSMYCTVGAFTPVEDPRPGHYFTMTLEHCLECGKCIEVCPCGFLQQA